MRIPVEPSVAIGLPQFNIRLGVSFISCDVILCCDLTICGKEGMQKVISGSLT